MASHRLRSLLLEMRVRESLDGVLAGAVGFRRSPGGTWQGREAREERRRPMTLCLEFSFLAPLSPPRDLILTYNV
jgi:hypothetical protein